MSTRENHTLPHAGVSRRQFIQGAVGALTAATAVSAGAQERPARKPSIVFLFSDEHRWQSMSFTELAGLQTPHMAQLATGGLSFNHCISNYPVCSPYRGILMSGRWPYHQEVTDNNIPLDANRMTIGKAFQQAGYKTGYIGKWHLGGERAEPFGFDTSLIWSGTNTHWDVAKYHPAEGAPVQPKGYNATLMTDQTLDFIDANAADPFFLMVSWNPPHANFLDPPEAKKNAYTPDMLPQRPNGTPHNDSGDTDADRSWSRFTWEYYQGYHGHVAAIDDELGRVTAKLDELGLAGDTIVIYTSDHGTMMGSHELGGKRQPYEESIRVPFMVRWPGTIPAGKTCDALFGTIDIPPTLCALAGIPVPDEFEGRDFSPWFLGATGPDPEAQPIMHIAKDNASGGNEHPAPLFRGVRTKTHTYAMLPEGPWILFDNASDPYQQTNLIDAPEHADLRAALHAKMIDLLRETGEKEAVYLA